MNDIQKNYLIGLVLKKLNTYDLESIKEVNVNNEHYVNNIEIFVEENAENTELIEDILNFSLVEETFFEKDGLTIEKIGLFASVKKDDKFFILNQDVFKDLLITMQSYMSQYLPLGSVVKLKRDEDDRDLKETIVVIEQRMIHPKGSTSFIDYRGVPYPMGIFNEQMYVNFLIDDIEEVIFEGYNDPENEGYELALKESLIGNNVFSKKYDKL